MSEIKANYHTHTTYCDGENGPREIVEEAARLDMTELGFSGHSYTSLDESYCMSRDGMQAYYDEIGALAEEYSSKIRILHAGEEVYVYCVVTVNRHDWAVVETMDGTYGYVSASYLDWESDEDDD